MVFGKMYAECPDYDASKSMADLFLEDGTYNGPKIGKNFMKSKYKKIGKESHFFFLCRKF